MAEKEPITVDKALNPDKGITIAGQSLIIKSLRMKEWQAMLEQYTNLLHTLSVLLEKDNITDADVKGNMDAVLADIMTAGDLGMEQVLKFFSYFCDGLSQEFLMELNQDDFRTLWVEVYERNARPFVFRRVQLAKMGILAAMRAELIRSVETEPSLLSSIEQVLTQELTETSPSNMPSKSRKRKRSGSSGAKAEQHS